MIKENITNIQEKRILKTFVILLVGISLQGCIVSRTHTGAVLGAATTTTLCINADPYVVAGCALTGAFAGAELMYNSDYDLHAAAFVDHLNTSPEGASYTNWYNRETGNSGIIHVTKSYLEGPIKCKDYSSTIDITNSWPLVGIGGTQRDTSFGTACQLPDGRWIAK